MVLLRCLNSNILQDDVVRRIWLFLYVAFVVWNIRLFKFGILIFFLTIFDHLCRCSLSLFPLICVFVPFFCFCWCHFFLVIAGLCYDLLIFYFWNYLFDCMYSITLYIYLSQAVSFEAPKYCIISCVTNCAPFLRKFVFMRVFQSVSTT